MALRLSITNLNNAGRRESVSMGGSCGAQSFSLLHYIRCDCKGHLKKDPVAVQSDPEEAGIGYNAPVGSVKSILKAQRFSEHR